MPLENSFIAICSAYDNTQSREEGIDNGMDLFLPKPVKKESMR